MNVACYNNMHCNSDFNQVCDLKSVNCRRIFIHSLNSNSVGAKGAMAISDAMMKTMTNLQELE